MYASPTRRRRASGRARRAPAPLLPSLLATALWAALPVHAADLTGPLQVSDGNTLQLGADDVLTHAAGSFALTVTGAGSQAVIDGSRINVTGSGSAVSASNGGQVQLRNATLSIAPTTGTGFYALYANGAGSVIDARDVDIDATRNGSGFGSVQAYNGGVIHYAGGRLSMTGTGGTLAGASGKGSELHLADLQMSADGGARLRADSAGLLTIRNSRITLAPGGILRRRGGRRRGQPRRAVRHLPAGRLVRYRQRRQPAAGERGSPFGGRQHATARQHPQQDLFQRGDQRRQLLHRRRLWREHQQLGRTDRPRRDLRCTRRIFRLLAGQRCVAPAADRQQRRHLDRQLRPWRGDLRRHRHGAGRPDHHARRCDLWCSRDRLHRQLRQPHRSHRQRDRCARRRRRRRVHRGLHRHRAARHRRDPR